MLTSAIFCHCSRTHGIYSVSLAENIYIGEWLLCTVSHKHLWLPKGEISIICISYSRMIACWKICLLTWYTCSGRNAVPGWHLQHLPRQAFKPILPQTLSRRNISLLTLSSHPCYILIFVFHLKFAWQDSYLSKLSAVKKKYPNFSSIQPTVLTYSKKVWA